MPFCTNCGNEIAQGTKFCPECGSKVEAPVTDTEPVVTAETPAEFVAPVANTVNPEETTPVTEPAVESESRTEELQYVAENTAPEGYTAPAEEASNAESFVEPVVPAYNTVPSYNSVPAYSNIPPVSSEPAKKKFNVFALIGLILSVLSLTMCWLSFINLVFLIPALVFVIIGLVKSRTCKKGFAIAGTVVCAVALILTIILTAVYVNLPEDSYDDDYSYDYDYDYDFDSDSDSDFNLFSNKLEDAYDLYCDYYYADIAYDGSYLSIDTNPYDIDDEFDTDAWEAIQEVNDYLDIPDSTEALMKNTRALDGRQEKTHGDVTVSWTYHPDSGLEVIYTLN